MSARRTIAALVLADCAALEVLYHTHGRQDAISYAFVAVCGIGALWFYWLIERRDFPDRQRVPPTPG